MHNTPSPPHPRPRLKRVERAWFIVRGPQDGARAASETVLFQSGAELIRALWIYQSVVIADANSAIPKNPANLVEVFCWVSVPIGLIVFPRPSCGVMNDVQYERLAGNQMATFLLILE